MAIHVACVVEGHGDVEAVPIVVRRIADAIELPAVIQIARPIRTPKSKLVKPGELERAVELAARTIGHRGAVFVLLDSDDDCPGELGPRLLGRILQHRDLHVSVVLAKREFESWFLAAAESLAGQSGLIENLQGPVNPEEIRGAKEWLSERMVMGRTYSPTVDQPILARNFSFEMARRATSFEKFQRDVTNTLRTLLAGNV